MTREESDLIQTAAFCAYVMLREGCTQEQAVQKMARLCAQTQIALGMGHIAVRPNA